MKMSFTEQGSNNQMGEQEQDYDSRQMYGRTAERRSRAYSKPRLRAFGKIESLTLGPSPAGQFDSPPTTYFVSGPGGSNP